MDIIDDIISEIKEKTGEIRLHYDFPSVRRKSLVTQKIPLIGKIYENTIRNLQASEGETKEVCGYLKFVKGELKRIPKSWDKYGIRSNFNRFIFHAETSGIETAVVVMSPPELKIQDMLPYQMKLKFIGRRVHKRFFLLVDEPQIAILQVPDIAKDLHALSMRDMMKGFAEIMPAINPLGKADRHILNAIISPYIGSDFMEHQADGIGSSYIQSFEYQRDMKRINIALENPLYSIPLEHIGVVNYIEGSPETIMQKRKEGFGKLRVLSWNLPSKNTWDVIRNSEFKYASDSELVFPGAERDLRNNTDLHCSLLIYALKPKVIKLSVFNEIRVIARQKIEELGNGGLKNEIQNIFDRARLDPQIGRIASFYSSFDYSKEFILKKVLNSLENNLESILEYAGMAGKAIPKDYEDYERRFEEIPDKFYIAVITAKGKDKGSIIENMIEKMGKTKKKAEEIFEEAVNKGLLYCRDKKYFILGDEDYKTSQD